MTTHTADSETDEGHNYRQGDKSGSCSHTEYACDEKCQVERPSRKEADIVVRCMSA